MAKDQSGKTYVSEAQAEASRKYQERKEAQKQHRIARQQRRDQRSGQEQTVRLDELLGVGVGAQKERERLMLDYI